ncbi:sulfite exporter TauE/SafE family protein [Halomonas sp. I5-271120]|uniref:sulfite exporter TauE/SafE family protein n=1 Tax=Halomonas sp. I5-271120 TaxID=3061632 RepID=UPI002714B95F|nr:sulfite exporter TauE/SafE family protein [Halomonas sp. I5-271120]
MEPYPFGRPVATAAAGHGCLCGEGVVGKAVSCRSVALRAGAVCRCGGGTLLSGNLSEQGVRLVLGVITLLFAAYMLLKSVARKPISTRWALPAASVCGSTSFMAHSGAPPINVYLLPRKYPKETFIATCAVSFAVVNVIKLGPYIWLGEVNVTSAWASLLLVPIAWVGVRSGLWLQSRVNETLFFRLVILAMFVVGVNLMWQALT